MNKVKPNILKILLSIFRQLSYIRKYQIILFLVLVIITAVFETISIASAIPFLKLLSNPNDLLDSEFISILNFSALESSENLLLHFCFIFAFLALIASSTRIFCLWCGSRVAALIGVDLSSECFKRNLYLPYSEQLRKNSSELISNNTLFINRTVDLLQTSARICTAIISVIFTSLFLFFYNPVTAIFSLITFIFIYLLLSKTLRKKLFLNSEVIALEGKKQVKLMQETLGGIREIILSNNYLQYLNFYKNMDKRIKLKEANNDFINLFPRYLIEGVSLIFISSLTYLIYVYKSDFRELLPTVGVFAISSQKLIPSLQQCYSGLSNIRGNYSSINNVMSILNLSIDREIYKNNKKVSNFNFKKYISLKNVSFKYSSSLPIVLKDINIQIFKGEKIGILGKTGSGKSTLIDIIIGLLKPRSGYIEIDGKNIYDKNLPSKIISWRKLVSYVPQDIFLKDGSIVDNIAFGVKNGEIDMEKIKVVAKEAMLEDFILKQPLKYKTRVGEKGVQLSGGQKQRIGIARALYRDCELLVFDEATSALDKKTEDKIMKNIYKIKRNLTILIITHRETTLNKCDRVFEIRDGSIFPK